MQQVSMFDSETTMMDRTIPTTITKGRQKLEEIIETGRSSAKRVIDHVQSVQPTDHIVKLSKLDFTFEGVKNESEKSELRVFFKDDEEYGFHRNAIGQAAQKANIPMTYVDMLTSRGAWGTELLAENFNTLFAHTNDKVLLRSVNKDVRGFLSDRYRRLDSRPLVDAFAKACGEVNALPYKGYVSDTKIGLQAIVAKVYEPIPGEYMAYGVSFENSDYGNGALNISFFLLRLVCLNGMMGETNFRRVHLGKRLDDDLTYSMETHKLDMRTIVSATRDQVLAQLAQERIDTMQSMIKSAYEKELTEGTLKSTMESLRKSLSKAEYEAVSKKFNEPDVVLVPPGQNIWRMANAVSWLAGEAEDEERKLDLQRISGKLLAA